MIHEVRIKKTESQAYMSTEEMKKYHHLNISYDLSLETPRVIKSTEGKADILRVEYNFSIVYTSPAMGYLRYKGEVDCRKDSEEIEPLSKELQDEIATNIMMNVLPLALLSSRSMGLPPAIPLPLPPGVGTTVSQQKDDIRGYG